MRRARVATLVMGALTALLVGVAVGFGAVGARGSDLAALVLTTLAVITTGAVGMVIGLKLPGHRVGSVLGGTALLYSTVFLAESYGRFALVEGHHDLPAGAWAALWANASWPLMFGGVIAVALVFPDGRLPSPRWRRVAVATAVCVAGTVTTGLFTDEPFDAPFADVASPLPALPGALAPVQITLLAGMLGCVVAAGVAARRRYVRAQQPERQQLLWLAASAWLIPATLVVCFADAAVPARLDAIVLGMLLITIIAVPVAIAVAVLRYRLYDLDRVINRTLVYGLLTLLVITAYYLVVVLVGGVVRAGSSVAVTLIATALVVVAMDPVRRRVQRRVDRLMYGDRADPHAGLSRLAQRLEDSLTPQMALRTIVETVADSLRVPYVAIELVKRDSHGGLARWRAVTHGALGPDGEVAVPLVFQGELIGELYVGHRLGEELAPPDHRLIAELARHAGAVVHATRLTLELQESRERLVMAQEEVRRRLRRDLHDDLGPTLAGAVFQVDMARDQLPAAGAEGAAAQLDALQEQLRQAVVSIRGMAYAIRPPALDHGLVAAIKEQVASLEARGAVPRITLSAPAAMPSLSPAVETAAYRIAMEAVANATKHSGARNCLVRIEVNGGLELEVVDDGDARGRGPLSPGVGITSMRERAAELGADLTVEQLARGTRVHTVLPMGTG